MRFEKTEKAVRFTTFCLNSLCVFSSLSTIIESLSSVLMSIRFCTVSCKTDCTFESLSRTSRVRKRILLT